MPKGSIIGPEEEIASDEEVEPPESSEDDTSVKEDEPSYNYDISPEYHQMSTNQPSALRDPSPNFEPQKECDESREDTDIVDDDSPPKEDDC